MEGFFKEIHKPHLSLPSMERIITTQSTRGVPASQYIRHMTPRKQFRITEDHFQLDKCVHTNPASVSVLRIMISFTALKTAATLSVSVAQVTCA